MPEGNELHRHANLQNEKFGNRVVTVDAPNGRFAEGAAKLNRRRLRALDAFGKHLFYDFGAGRQLHVHLGLYGKYKYGQMPYPEMKGMLRLRISTKTDWLELRGPTACDVLSDAERLELLERIGPDPLREDADAAVAIARIRKSRAPIGALLMDQSVISGIGNIYRAELLYRAKVHPLTPGNAVAVRILKKLWADAVALMTEGMVDRRIVTTRPADRPHPKGKARRFETHYVYRRKGLPCFVCGSEVQMKEFVGRKLYWCPGCQPEISPPE